LKGTKCVLLYFRTKHQTAFLSREICQIKQQFLLASHSDSD